MSELLRSRVSNEGPPGRPKQIFIQHEEGRLVPGTSAGSYDYQYHIKDHLGNTRVTLTSASNVSGYLATFEDATYLQDTTDFFNVDPRVPYPVGGKAVRLNSAAPIGPGFAAAISPGDTINISVKAYYEDATGHGTSSLGATTLAAALTAAYGGLNGGSEGQQLIHDVFNNHAGAAVAAGGTGNDAQPSAYLNYLVFDEDYNLVSDKTGYVGVPLGNNLEWTLQVDELVVEQAGFIYIYVSNESVSSNYVFFDNLDVAISESPILETTDYYPFGLAFNEYTKPGTVEQRWKFGGKEQINDFELKWSDHGARLYSPDLGRWSVIDPKADIFFNTSPYVYSLNNPIYFVDDDGEIPIPAWLTRIFNATKTSRLPANLPRNLTFRRVNLGGRPTWRTVETASQNILRMFREGFTKHQQWSKQMLRKGWEVGRYIGKGKDGKKNFVDALRTYQGKDGVWRGVIRELKPGSASGVLRGIGQLRRYLDVIKNNPEFKHIQEWSIELEVYYSTSLTLSDGSTVNVTVEYTVDPSKSDGSKEQEEAEQRAEALRILYNGFLKTMEHLEKFFNGEMDES